jgi:hypothetical protein
MSSQEYRIYSRISREILDEFWALFYEFDLYAGHKIVFHKLLFSPYLGNKPSLFHLNQVNFFWNFGQFLPFIFSIRLIRGSTYTRVYTVVKNLLYGWFHFKKMTLRLREAWKCRSIKMRWFFESKFSKLQNSPVDSSWNIFWHKKFHLSRKTRSTCGKKK